MHSTHIHMHKGTKFNYSNYVCSPGNIIQMVSGEERSPKPALFTPPTTIVHLQPFVISMENCEVSKRIEVIAPEGQVTFQGEEHV